MHVSEGDERPINDWLPFVVAHADTALVMQENRRRRSCPRVVTLCKDV